MPKDVKPAAPAALNEPSGGLSQEVSSPGNSSGAEVLVPSPEAVPHRPASENCRDCLGALAHRLAQTATALRGGLELGLLTKRSATEYQAILQQALELADRMVQLIVSLRDLAESNSPAGPPLLVALEPMIKEVLEEMQGFAESRDLHFQVPAGRSVQVLINPGRLREVFQGLLAWIIQSASCGGTIKIHIASTETEVLVSLVPPRLDFQYLQVKMLEDIANPGLLFSHAMQSGTMGWAINRRLVEGLGGKLEIVAKDAGEDCVRARFPVGHPRGGADIS